MKSNYSIIFFLILTISCAKRGIPEGGEKDEIAPKYLKAQPENNSIFFNDKKIRIKLESIKPVYHANRVSESSKPKKECSLSF